MKKLFGITAFVLCAAMSTSVFADSMTYDVRKSKVAFSVDDTGRATAYADKASSQYFYAKEIDAVNGVVTDDFRIPEGVASGEYTLSVVADLGETTLIFNHMNLTQAAPAVASIISKQTASDIQSEIAAYISDLGISVADFTAYGATVSQYLATADKSVDAADFWNDYHSALVLAKTSGATDATIDTVLKNDGGYTGFDYGVFSSYSSEVKNSVYAKLAAGTLTEQNLSDVLSIWIALARLNNEHTATEYQRLLTVDYAQLFGIDTTGFEASTKKTEIIKEIMNVKNGYATKTSIADAYKAALAKCPNPATSPSAPSTPSNPSNSGTSTGNTSGSTVSLPNESLEELDNSEKIFSDVANDHWAKEIIAELKEQGIVSGTDGKFYPNDSISRAEFCTMIAQCFFKDEKAVGNVSFSDVSSSQWFYPYTTLLAEKGIVNGVGDGSFCPNDMITREDMAVIALRCLKEKTAVEESDYLTFIDAQRIADYAQTAVATLCNEGILSGTPEGMFNPKNNLTRAEAAVVVYKLLHRLEA